MSGDNSAAMPILRTTDTPLHFVRAGAGSPPLVFVHGSLCALDDWHHQLSHFQARHRVLALDLPGHGESDPDPAHISIAHYARCVVALCRAEHVARAVLVGHSMGCRVLLEVARTHPGLVAGLVCVDGAYLVDGLLGLDDAAVDRGALAQQARARAAAVYADVSPAERARHGFAQMFFDARHAALRDAIVQRAMALPPEVARTLMPDFAAWDVLHMEPALAQLGRLGLPLLAIACTWMTPQRRRSMLAPGDSTPWLLALQRFMPHASVRRLADTGHFAMLERPQQVNREIEDFLGTLPG